MAVAITAPYDVFYMVYFVLNGVMIRKRESTDIPSGLRGRDSSQTFFYTTIFK